MTETNVIRLREMPKRIPTNGTFELTVRCNLHCKMCLFRHADSENAALRAGELTAAQWIDMARQAAEAGTFSLLITGGEPMLRPDFCEIWEGVYRQGFLMELYTNATLVTPQIMETLRNYPPHRIGVTVYGASPATYEAVCGSADAFQRMLDGVRQLQTLPSVFEFRTTIIRDNYCDTDAIRELVQNEFQSDAVVIYSATITKAVRGACADVEACRLDPETEYRMHLQRKLDVIREFVGESFDLRRVGVREKGVNLIDSRRAPLLGCPGGISSYTVNWNGKLQPCQMFGVFHTDAMVLGLQAAWECLPEVIVLPPASDQCRSCPVADCCETCYATRFAETGSLNGCSEYLYRAAELKQNILKEYRGIENGKTAL